MNYSSIKNNYLLLCILLLYLFLALYKLDAIPGAIWGDAIFHYNLAQRVLHGHLFFDYQYGGDGPFFTYLVVFLTNFVGLSFYSLKLTAVFIGFFFVLSMYFLTKEFFQNKTIALLATATSAISFWTIDFARQPHPRILVPLFICLTLLYTLKKKNTITGILLGIGLYTQASFWGLIFTYWRTIKILFVGLVFAIPLLYMFLYNPIGFFSNQSYFGEKLAVHTPLSQTIIAILHNITANLLSFNIRGDTIFRMNIPGHPHLDIFSGILFDIGFLLIVYRTIKKKENLFFLYFILPFFFIQIPSFLDVHNYFSQPNISRMIGVIPFVYMSIAYCIFVITRYLSAKMHKQHIKKITVVCSYTIFLLTIFILNFYNYFIIYPKTLPNNNTPFDKIIAQTIDTFPRNTFVVIVGSGWGEYAQPEVAGIPIVQQTTHQEIFMQTIEQTQELLCQTQKKKQQVLIISNPLYKNDLQSTNLCINKQKTYMQTSNGWNVAYVIEGISN